MPIIYQNTALACKTKFKNDSCSIKLLSVQNIYHCQIEIYHEEEKKLPLSFIVLKMIFDRKRS